MIISDQINVAELCKRSEQVGQIAGDTFGDNLFIETQAVSHAASHNADVLPPLLLLIDGLYTVAINNIETARSSAREAIHTSHNTLHQLAMAYIALSKAFMSQSQAEDFHRSAIKLISDDIPANNIANAFRNLAPLPSSGLEYKLSAIHGKSHALNKQYQLLRSNLDHDTETPVSSLRHILHHVIGHSHALGYTISGGLLTLGDTDFNIQRSNNEEGARYMIVDGDYGATTQISYTNPYSQTRNIEFKVLN